ncbi:carbohydrate ABC transporter permease [Pseudotabrizicola alkalilacus]|uniref:Sugar ABC transporter permease n=1 Tax=Pseudotabrizicola alkalilacus TaxID=2305252 RepID=A0A411Z202_9RHOB|nr:sugar ABC transporter permease [Pseudotabrizicola alkalilacus]RGP37089.1 sugar ABC transporter permease [Pseudotabrizicola alkalilacus]
MSHTTPMVEDGPTGADRLKPFVPYLLVLPGLLFVMGILGYAVVGGIILSLNETDMFMNKTFVGLKNYIDVFADPRFQDAMVRTLNFVVISIVLGIFMSMSFALVLYKVVRGRRFFRGLSLVPYFVSGIATAVMFRFIFTTSGGFVNTVLAQLGLPAQSWLGDPTLAFVVAIMANCWFMVPFASLILLGGLQTIDKDLYDAAAIDGANPIQIFFRITLPLIKPMLGVSLIWVSYISFSTFDIVLALTSGGPLKATELVSIYMYELAFQQLNFGQGAVLMVVLLVFNTVLSLIYIKIFVMGDRRHSEAGK